jgi:Tol biopolymer transport system component
MRVVPVTTLAGYELMPTLSPDGDQVAFARTGEGENIDIHVTLVGSGTSRRLTTDAEIDFYPSWSPDGRQIAFVRRLDDAAGRVFVIDPLGGGERRVSDFPVMFDRHGAIGQISWSPDGTHIAAAPAFPSVRDTAPASTRCPCRADSRDSSRGPATPAPTATRRFRRTAGG